MEEGQSIDKTNKKGESSKLIPMVNDHLKRAEEYYRSEYIRSEEDIKFVYGEQWDDYEANEARKGRPKLVENRMLSFKHQVLNTIRQADMSIKLSPVDSGSDVDTAEVRQGLVRHIEQVNKAQEAYDTAADTAITGGYGYIRIYTDYCDDNSFDKEVVIEPIVNWRSVLMDPDAMRIDGSDAEWAIVFDDMLEEDYKAKYPNKAVPEWEDGDEHGFNLDQGDTKKVRVAEYHYKHREPVTLYLLEDGTTTEEKPESYTDMRQSEKVTVRWLKTNGKEILDSTEFESEYIGIVPVYGDRVWKKGRMSSYSLIHQAKDPQRILNYYKSTQTELVALQPRAPYIGALGAFNSRQEQWVGANVGNPTYLEFDIVKDENGNLAPPPFRERPPETSPTISNEMIASVDAIKSVLGMHDARLGADSQEVSGVAIRNRQLQGDNSTYHFVDNLAASIRHVGVVCNDIIGRIYTQPKVIRILGSDGLPSMIPFNQPYVKEGDEYLTLEQYTQGHEGEIPPPEKVREFNLKDGKYDVVVEVGSNYATRRQETLETWLELLQIKPDLMDVAADLILKNMDFTDADTLIERVKSMMPAEVLGDDPQAMALQQAQQQVQVLEQNLLQVSEKLNEKQENQQQENALKAEKNDIDRMLAQAKVMETQMRIAQMQQEGASVEDIKSLFPDLMESLQELNERTADNEQALDVIIASAEGGDEVASQPRGLLSRIFGRNSNGGTNE